MALSCGRSPVLCNLNSSGADQLEVILTGTARARQGFGEFDHDAALDRDSGVYNGPQARWPFPVAVQLEQQ